MALATYSDLKASLAGWLHRTDLNGAAVGAGVDNIASDWIALFEAEANADLRLRTMEADVALTTVVGSRYVDLPAGYLEPLALFVTWATGQTPYELRFVPMDQNPRWVPNAAPQFWSIDGSRIALDSPADKAYPLTFRMLQGFALSVSSPTNWLLTNYPGLYLYGALRHSPMYLAQDPRAGGWERMYAQAKALLDAKEARTNHLATLSVDPAMRARPTPFNIYRG